MFAALEYLGIKPGSRIKMGNVLRGGPNYAGQKSKLDISIYKIKGVYLRLFFSTGPQAISRLSTSKVLIADAKCDQISVANFDIWLESQTSRALCHGQKR